MVIHPSWTMEPMTPNGEVDIGISTVYMSFNSPGNQGVINSRTNNVAFLDTTRFGGRFDTVRARGIEKYPTHSCAQKPTRAEIPVDDSPCSRRKSPVINPQDSSDAATNWLILAFLNQNQSEKADFGYCWEMSRWLTFSLLKIHGSKTHNLL